MAETLWFDTSNSYIKYRIELETNYQNLENNYSKITVRVRAKRTNSATTYGTGTCYCTIDEVQYSQSISSAQKITSDGICLFEKTMNISHNTDGTKSLNIRAKISHSRFSSEENIWVTSLDKIARLSTFTVDGVQELGQSINIRVSKAKSTYVHTIAYTCGNQSDIINTKSEGDVFLFVPPFSLSEQNTSGTNLTITISCTAYDGDTKLGTYSQTYTYAIPESVKPTCAIDITDTSGCYEDYGLYVQGKSTLQISITPTLAYNSPIASYSLTVDGKTYATSSTTTGVLSSTGTINISAAVTDQRSRKGTATKSIDIVEYEPPSVKKLQVTRCNADGTENFEGEYGKVVFEATASEMSGQNTVDYSLHYVQSSGYGGDTVELTDYKNNFAASGSVIIPLSSSYTYDVTLTATDKFTSVSLKTSASAGFALIHFGADGRSLAFGKITEHQQEAEFNLPIRPTAGVTFVPIASETNFNNMTVPGIYTGDASSGQYTNCPVEGSFTLEVSTYGSNGVMQLVRAGNAKYDESYRRTKDSSTWSLWYVNRPNATIEVSKGGTGAESFTEGSILSGNGSSTFTELLGIGALFASEEGKPNFGTLPVNLGGTGATDAANARKNIAAASEDHDHKFADITDVSTSDGYIKLGLYAICWGNITVSSMNGARSASVSFSHFSAMPMMAVTAVCATSGAAGTSISAYITALSASSATIRFLSSYTGSLSVGACWIAIGKSK